MVSDHAVGGQVGLALRVAVPGQFLHAGNQRQEEVGFIVGGCAL